MNVNLPAGREYRPDIDGLRAIAVLSVFLFHLNPQVLPGGFLGVDVFFVISGYLISSIIIREQQLNSFSFVNFYARRIKRIFPALFVVLVLAAGVAIIMMPPETYTGFMKSARYASAQLSNFFFSQKVDYFEEGFSGQPLLHTWSLGVEEQFYLFWPLLIFLCFQLVPGTLHHLRIGMVFLVLGVVSFLFCYHFASSDHNHAFYMFYTRAFEFCIGGFLALKIVPAARSMGINLMVGILGVALLIYSFLFVGEEVSGRSFLKFGVLLPCVGSALLIYASQEKSFVNRLMSTRVPVYVGKISYSLYLYHWPVIIFWKYFNNSHSLGLKESGVIILISFLCASLSYFFVEQPLRRSTFSQRKTVLAAVVIIIVFASGFRILEGFDDSSWRIARYEKTPSIQPQLRDVPCKKRRKDGVMYFQCQESGNDTAPVVGLIGDSHAPHFLEAATSWAKNSGYNVKYHAIAGCPMVLGDVSLDQSAFDEKYTEQCEKGLDLLNSAILDDPRVEIVMIAQRFDLLYDGMGYLNYKRILTFKDQQGRLVKDHTQYYEGKFSETIESFKNRGKQVVILKQVPINPRVDSCTWTPILYRLLDQENSNCEFDDEFISEWQQPSIDFVDMICRKHRIDAFDPVSVMDSPRKNGKNLYLDKDHLNNHGTKYLVPHFGQRLTELVSDQAITQN